MAIYTVSRKDATAIQEGEFVSAVVRAKGRVQARKLILDATAGGMGVTATNLDVQRVQDGRDVVNGVILSSFAD